MSRIYSCPNCGASVAPNDLFCQTCGIELMKIQSSQFKKPSDRAKEYRGYIQILGYVEMVFGVLSLVIGLLVLIIAVFIPILILQDVETDASAEVVAIFFGIFIFIVAVLFLIFGIAQIVYGRRLLQYRSSGRMGTIIIGVLHLFDIPLGTAFGIAALYILTRPETIDLFED